MESEEETEEEDELTAGDATAATLPQLALDAAALEIAVIGTRIGTTAGEAEQEESEEEGAEVELFDETEADDAPFCV